MALGSKYIGINKLKFAAKTKLAFVKIVILLEPGYGTDLMRELREVFIFNPTNLCSNFMFNGLA